MVILFVACFLAAELVVPIFAQAGMSISQAELDQLIYIASWDFRLKFNDFKANISAEYGPNTELDRVLKYSYSEMTTGVLPKPGYSGKQSFAACEDRFTLLQCGNGTVIKTDGSIYGRQNFNNVCWVWTHASDYYHPCWNTNKNWKANRNHTEKFSEWCDGKEECIVFSSDLIGGNPCPIIPHLYTETYYYCVEKENIQ